MSAQTEERRDFTRRLLRCGAVAGPLFIVLLLVQDFTRSGFDPRIHLLSQLSLGSWGWVQVGNLTLAGVLNVLYAVGLWRSGHRPRLASIFVGLFAGFLVLVGVVRTDPAHGFPPGAATPAQPSVSGIIHALGALFTFVSLTVAIIALSVGHAARGERGMASYCFISALLVVGLFLWGMSHPALTGPALQVAVLFGWTVPSFTAIGLLRAG
jgi:hypothetical membrane protein